MEKSECHVNEEGENKWKSKSLGVCLSFLSALVLLTQNTILQKMNLHFNDVLLIKAVVQILPGLIFIKIKGESVWIKDVDVGQSIHKIRIMLFTYGLFGALFNSTDLIAVYFMPLGDAMTIILSSVLPTVILAAIFLKERLRLCKVCSSVLVITGLVIVIRPPFLFAESKQPMNYQEIENSSLPVLNQSLSGNLTHALGTNISRSQHYYIGVLAGLICMISSASFRIVLKILVKNKSTSSFGIALFYNSFCNLIAALSLPAFGGDQRILFPSANIDKYDIWQWAGLFGIAFLGITQYSMRFMAIKLISPVMVSFIRTSEIIVAYIIQITFFGTEPYMTTVVGSGFVMIACIGVILESWMLKRVHSKIQWLF